MADPLLKELDKLERLCDISSTRSTKDKSISITSSLDALLASLHDARRAISQGEPVQTVAGDVRGALGQRKKEIDDRQKEIYNSLTRFGKGLDKKFPNPLPQYPPLFKSPEALAALERVIAMHYIRTGAFDIAETFIEEAKVQTVPNSRDQFVDMHRIVDSLREDDLEPALEWCALHRSFLRGRASPLEFNLRRSHFVHLLQTSLNAGPALSYARLHFPSLHPTHSTEIQRLMNAILYAGPNLGKSPYADLVATVNSEMGLDKQFAKEYCASLRMSRQVPLRAVGDIGGGGALARIEKGKRVMQEKETNWDNASELPIEIPVPSENRYHSVFACPVSKEQSTEGNPPMMLACGHVLAKDSVNRLVKPGGRVKCPYCPMESVSPALRVYF